MFDDFFEVRGVKSERLNFGILSFKFCTESGADSRNILYSMFDGDKYHGIERWLEDTSRQRTLERMGWLFWRCWGSNYISDKDACLNDLFAKLDSLRIEPIGFNTTLVCGVSDHRTVGEFNPDVLVEQSDTEVIEEPGPELVAVPESLGTRDIRQKKPIEPVTEASEEMGNPSDSYVQINDTVTYAYTDNPDDLKMVQIVRGKGSVSDGIINHTSPIAQTLLGAFLNEQVTAYLPTGSSDLKIIDIVKS